MPKVFITPYAHHNDLWGTCSPAKSGVLMGDEVGPAAGGQWALSLTRRRSCRGNAGSQPAQAVELLSA